MRIVSLVPSITELLYALGLEQEVVGITKFCVHPAKWKATKSIIGGTKNVRLHELKNLKPTLVIANKEENIKEQVEAIQKFAPVLVTNIIDFNENEKLILQIGEAVEKIQIVQQLDQQIKQAAANYQKINKLYSVAYLIWNNPIMTIGGDTFINSMLQQAGFQNVFEHVSRYPQISVADIENKKPDFIFLSSEPYPFNTKHITEFQQIFPYSKVVSVDGEMFSWYGYRPLLAFPYFEELTKQLALA